MAARSPQAFRSISEAAAELGVPAHALRFWETRFSFIRPMTRSGGRRFYRPHDIEVLRGVRALLHDEGYTIKGVQRLHREEGMARVVGAGLGRRTESPPDPRPGAAPSSAPHTLRDEARSALRDVLADLERVKGGIDRLLLDRPPES